MKRKSVCGGRGERTKKSGQAGRSRTLMNRQDESKQKKKSVTLSGRKRARKAWD